MAGWSDHRFHKIKEYKQIIFIMYVQRQEPGFPTTMQTDSCQKQHQAKISVELNRFLRRSLAVQTYQFIMVPTLSRLCESKAKVKHNLTQCKLIVANFILGAIQHKLLPRSQKQEVTFLFFLACTLQQLTLQWHRWTSINMQKLQDSANTCQKTT